MTGVASSLFLLTCSIRVSFLRHGVNDHTCSYKERSRTRSSDGLRHSVWQLESHPCLAGKLFAGTDGVQAKSATGKTVALVVRTDDHYGSVEIWSPPWAPNCQELQLTPEYSSLNCSLNLYPHAESATTRDRPGAPMPRQRPPSESERSQS